MKICPSCQREYPDDEDFCATDGMKLRPRDLSFTDPLVGAMLDGRWVIEERIGEGGMGAVYRAHQQSVDRPVAVKTLRNEHIHDHEYVERFFREAQVAAKISHPHCVTIHDFGQDAESGTLYLAMEYLEGTPLTHRIEARDLTISEVVQIGIQISSALAAAHETSVVHRDLKPDNIFLIEVAGGGTFIKVLDFGIAKLLEAETRMTKTGVVMGTPMYMSPEQCNGEEIDLRSDLYSLGCILYEALCGRAPFFAETPMAVLLAHVSKPVITPRELGVEVPDALASVVMKLLEKSADDRYQDASELRAALEDASTRLGDGSRVVSTFAMNRDAWVFDETAALPVGSVEARKPAGETIDSIQRDGGSKKLLAVLLVVAVLVVFAGVALGLALSEDDDAGGPGPVSPASISSADAPGAAAVKDNLEQSPRVPDHPDAGALADQFADPEPDGEVETERGATAKDRSSEKAGKNAEKRRERAEKKRERLRKKREEKRKRARKSRKAEKKQKSKEKSSDPAEPVAEAIEDRVEEERRKARESMDKEVEKIEKDTREALDDFGDLF